MNAIRIGPAIILLGFVLAGCARGSGVETPSPQPQPPLPIDLAIFEPPEDEPEDEPAPDFLLLEEAERHLSEGRFRRAAPIFARYLEKENEAESDNGAPPHAERALWGIAMLHLLPESPLYDHERATEALDRLAEDYGDSVLGLQAKWIQGLLNELDQVRAQAHAQEELLRQLTETVEQLKRIDLNRRPTGAGDTTMTGDTVPPGRDLTRRR